MVASPAMAMTGPVPVVAVSRTRIHAIGSPMVGLYCAIDQYGPQPIPF